MLAKRLLNILEGTPYKRNIKRYREIQRYLHPYDYSQDLPQSVLDTFPPRKKILVGPYKGQQEGNYWGMNDDDRAIYDTHRHIEVKKRGYPSSGNSETIMRNRVYRHNVTFGQGEKNPHDGIFPSKKRQ